MRDPTRIPEVLQIVEKLWKQMPDMRLGQLLWFLSAGDPFYLEDNALIQKVIEMIDG